MDSNPLLVAGATSPVESAWAVAQSFFTVSSRGALLAEWALILAIFFVVGGAPAPDVNETHYWTKALRYWDPTYCPGDPFLDSGDAHVTFYWTLGRVAQWTSLASAAWIGRLLTWSFLAWGWLALARTVLPWRFGPSLAASLMAALVAWCHFAGEWVIGGAEGKTFAYGLVWLGLAALVRGRWAWAWIWLGTATAWHVLVGGWSALAAVGVWLSEPRKARPSIWGMRLGWGIGAMASLIGIWPALRLEHGVSAETSAEAAEIYVFQRLPHHLAPLALPVSEATRRCARFGGLLCVAVFLWRALRGASGPPGVKEPGEESEASVDRLWRFAGCCAAIFAIGLAIEIGFMADRVHAARWLRLYWFRVADVMIPTTVALFAVRWMATAAAAKRRGWQASAVAAVLVGGWHLLVVSAERWHRPAPPADRSTLDVEAWRDACAWIGAHAPGDALSFIPRNHQSFRWYAGRGDVGNWKDVPQNAEAVVAWFARCRDLYRPLRTLTATSSPAATGMPAPTAKPTATSKPKPPSTRMVNWPSELGAERIRELAARYGFQYVVTAREPALRLARLYENSHYAIYWTGATTRQGSPP